MIHMGSKGATVNLPQDEPAIVFKEAGTNVPVCFSGTQREKLVDILPKADEYLNSKRRKTRWEKFRKAVCLSPAELP